MTILVTINSNIRSPNHFLHIKTARLPRGGVINRLLFKMPGKFQLNTKTIFLTYPQAPESWTKESLLAALESKCPTFINYTIAQEIHLKGGVHFHVLLEFVVPFRTKNERYFDIDGKHPNIQSGRNPLDIRRYIEKDGGGWSFIKIEEVAGYGDLPAFWY